MSQQKDLFVMLDPRGLQSFVVVCQQWMLMHVIVLLANHIQTVRSHDLQR